MRWHDAGYRRSVRRALGVLGVKRCVLAIHDRSFPGVAGEDPGRGSPYGAGARSLLRFLHQLGFDGVQLGPQGWLSEDNPSPYDGALLSAEEANLDLGRLRADPATGELFDSDAVANALSSDADPERAEHEPAWRGVRAAVDGAFARFASTPQAFPEVAAVRRRFDTAHPDWPTQDGIFLALFAQHGHRAPAHWTGPDAARDRRLAQASPDAEQHGRFHDAIARHRFAQSLLTAQHEELRARAAALELKLYGDLQAGASFLDVHVRQALFLFGYAMGAPPSRTNPAGQPWGYPVLDPEQLGTPDSPGPALRFLLRRVQRLFEDYDGLRVDHPHALCCPWVYDSARSDALAAVQQGARLYAAPDLPDHPALWRQAIARPEQLDRAQPRHADGWVQALDEAQEARYARVMDALIATAEACGRGQEAVVCEVLSTLPYPLGRVMARHGLGRFRILQKANPADPADVYRCENAAAADWVMLGTHDTPPIWRVIERWTAEDRSGAYARWLGGLLTPDGEDPAPLVESLGRHPNELATAGVAALLASRAESFALFFADLFGLSTIYNRAGEPHPDNWTLRLAPDFEARYADRARAGRAVDLPRALYLALRARGVEGDLLEALASLSSAAPPGR